MMCIYTTGKALGAHLLGHVAIGNLVAALGGSNTSERLRNENKGGTDVPEHSVHGGAPSDDPAVITSMAMILSERFTPLTNPPRMDAANVLVLCRVRSTGLVPILHWFNVYMVDGEHWFSFNFDTAVLRLTRANLESYGVLQIREALAIFKRGKGHSPAPPPSCEGMFFWYMVTGTDCLHHAWANAVGYKGEPLKLPKLKGGGLVFRDFIELVPNEYAWRGIKLGISSGPESFDTLGMRLYAHAFKAGPKKNKRKNR
jgi:hypothetical protein